MLQGGRRLGREKREGLLILSERAHHAVFEGGKEKGVFSRLKLLGRNAQK